MRAAVKDDDCAPVSPRSLEVRYGRWRFIRPVRIAGRSRPTEN